MGNGRGAEAFSLLTDSKGANFKAIDASAVDHAVDVFRVGEHRVVDDDVVYRGDGVSRVGDGDLPGDLVALDQVNLLFRGDGLGDLQLRGTGIEGRLGFFRLHALCERGVGVLSGLGRVGGCHVFDLAVGCSVFCADFVVSCAFNAGVGGDGAFTTGDFVCAKLGVQNLRVVEGLGTGVGDDELVGDGLALCVQRLGFDDGLLELDGGLNVQRCAGFVVGLLLLFGLDDVVRGAVLGADVGTVVDLGEGV